MLSADDDFQVQILNYATGVSRPKIRKILEIAREMEMVEMTDRQLARQRLRGRMRAEILDGGCAVFRPKRFNRTPYTAA
jgi:hypothetical protein